MSPEAASRPLVADQVFARLLEGMLSGRWPAGEKLPPQRRLATELGVTMTALREGLKRLEQMGLVEVRHGDATRVRDWRDHGGLDVLGHLLFRDGGVDRALLADVFEAREHMLTAMARLAAERCRPPQAERLRTLAEAYAAADSDAQAQGLDFAWAAELAAAAGNVVFLLVLNAIRDLYFGHAELIPVAAGHEALAPLYVRAAEAIARGDGEAAGAAATDLSRAQRQRVLGRA